MKQRVKRSGRPLSLRVLVGAAVSLGMLGVSCDTPPEAAAKQGQVEQEASAAECLPEFPGTPIIIGTEGNDTLDGTAGPERICGFGGIDTVRGLDANDNIAGGDGDDILMGNVGDDIVQGNAGLDRVWGGRGNDVVRGGRDNDMVYGDVDHDQLWGDVGADRIEGGAGDDRAVIRVGDELDTLYDESGTDALWLPDRTNPWDLRYVREGNNLRVRDAARGIDIALIENHYGAGAIESVEFGTGAGGAPENNIPYGNVDFVSPARVTGWVYDPNRTTGSIGVQLYVKRLDQSVVMVIPATANQTRSDVPAQGFAPIAQVGFTVDVPMLDNGDYLYELYALDAQGNSARNALIPHSFGTVRYQTGSMETTRSECVSLATDGPDYIRALDGDDTLFGKNGADFLFGNKGRDVVNGNGGNDWLFGGLGEDNVRGGQGDDTLYGDDQDDTLYGDLNNDTLYGGGGADRFVYRRGDGEDTVMDAVAGDSIVLTRIKSTEVTYTVSGADYIVRLNSGGSIRIVNYFASSAPPAITFDTRPNIVLIFADDLGYGEIAPYAPDGEGLIKTPNLTAMAQQGLKFTDFYSSAALCPPARNALLSGRHTGHTPVRWFNGERIVPPLNTMAQVMTTAGYATGMFGKWGMGDNTTESAPHLMGWGSFVGMMSHWDAHAQFLDGQTKACNTTPVASHLWRGSAATCSTVPYEIRNDRYVNDEFTDQALAFIDTNRQEPFFLYLPYTLPHAELVVPTQNDPAGYLLQQYLVPGGDPSNPASSIFPETPYSGTGAYCRSQPMPRATFAAMVSRLDWYVGRIIQRLQQHGLDEDTLIVFTSDNGPAVAGGKTPEDLVFFNSTAGLKGSKFTLFEGGLRVPTLVRWPGRIAGGVSTSVPAAGYDLLPTFAELAGVTVPGTLDGVSLVPVLNGSSTPLHEFLYFEGQGQAIPGAAEGSPDATSIPRQAVRYGPWKGVRRFLGGDPNDGSRYVLELYNLGATGGVEVNNVAGDPANAAVLERIKQLMNSQHDPNNILPGDYPVIPSIE